MTLRMLALCLILAGTVPAPSADAQMSANPVVRLTTTEGDIVIRLDARRAPITVSNFLSYVREGHYDGTIFHRVIPGFMAQGGGFDKDMTEKPTGRPIPNESGNGHSNLRGTIAMARTGDPHSATAQFFINLVDNERLDPSPRGWGYTVFGAVTEGLEILDKIATMPTGAKGRFQSDVPNKDVIITSARLLDADAK